jgi:tetratricopeptide (TPR) repeat protein
MLTNSNRQSVHCPFLVFLLTFVASWQFCASARAALDAEADKPYELKVVLDIARHRQLTPVFIDQLERDLRDLLQTELGDLAHVKVVRSHPLLKVIRAKGLEAALNAYQKIDGVKLHFVQLDLAGGRYELQARQYDGNTGRVSYSVRKDQTSDRRLVARRAALLVKRDFGIVGTVTKVANETVEVTLKGGNLGVDLKPWVGSDEVFAVSQITRASGGLHGTRMPWTLLQVKGKPQGGVCTCRLYHRFQHDTLTNQPGILGYRCLKLSTVRVPLRMRFLDFKTREPLQSLQVHISAAGQEAKRQVTTDQEGLIPRTEESYAHLAIVKVLSGGKVRAQMPVAMLGERTVDCLLRVSAEDEEQGHKELRRDRWLRRIYDSLKVSADRVAELNELGKKSLRREALDLAKEGLQSLETDLKSLNEEKDLLAKEGGLDLGEGKQLLDELDKRRQELDRFVSRLGKVIKEEKDPKRRDMLSDVERARLLETQADFDQAIDLYEKILDAHPKQTNVRERLVRLKKAWAKQDEKHGKARTYIYKTWPALTDPAKLQEARLEIRWAFEVCKAKGDALSPQKILRTIVKHTDHLKKRLNALGRLSREDDRKEAEIIAEVAKELKKLHKDVADYLKEKKPEFP